LEIITRHFGERHHKDKARSCRSYENVARNPSTVQSDDAALKISLHPDFVTNQTVGYVTNMTKNLA